MNLGPLLVLAKLFGGLGLTQTVIGPPDPNKPESFCYRTDGKLTFPCWQKYVDPGGSRNDWEDYLKDR